jgi:hypothetical protein
MDARAMLSIAVKQADAVRSSPRDTLFSDADFIR